MRAAAPGELSAARAMALRGAEASGLFPLAAGLGAGELRMNGVDYPISDTCTGTCSVGRRKLSTDAEVKEPVVFHGPRKGRKLGFFSALMTSGSFMMMQAGAF